MSKLDGLPYPWLVLTLFGIVMLRANATYWLGRGAESGAERTRLARVLRSERFRRAQRIVGRWGAPVVTVSFLTVGIQTLINLAAGVARMPLRRYLPAVTLGCVLWAFLYATVGVVTLAAWRRVYELSPAGATVGTIVLAGALAGFVAWQLRHREETENDRETASVAAHDGLP